MQDEWRKATMVLPLMVTVFLALAVAGYATHHLLASRSLDRAAVDGAQGVTAFELRDRFATLFDTSRRLEGGDESVVTATLIEHAQVFDYGFMRLMENGLADMVRERGLNDEFRTVQKLVYRLDSFVKGESEVPPDVLASQIEAARPAVRALSLALSESNRAEVRNTYDRMTFDAFVILALAVLLVLAVAFMVRIEGHRRRNLIAKTRALEISESKLRDLSFYRQQFLANMSHEFRTPLNAIQGFSEAILMQKDSMKQERVFEYVDIVARSARDLARLTEDVLDMSKIDAGKFDITREEVPFTALIEDSLIQFDAVARQKDIDIRKSIEADWVVDCDRLAIKRCITNVLSNALKFSDPGGSIYVNAYLRDRRMLVLEVQDLGCGIPERDLQSIWMVYARSSITRKSDREGAGLGLAMVKALMDAHNGFVELQSREGVGTAVRLCFPLSMIVSTSRPALPPLQRPASAKAHLRAV